jgi:hypothetical protein
MHPFKNKTVKMKFSDSKALLSTQGISKVMMGLLTLSAPSIINAGEQEQKPNVLMVVIDDPNEWNNLAANPRYENIL